MRWSIRRSYPTLDLNAVYSERDGSGREKADRVISVGVFINTPFPGWEWDFNETSWAIWNVIIVYAQK